MRRLAVSLGLGLVLLSGCTPLANNVIRSDTNRDVRNEPPPPQVPQLVAFLNSNAQKIQAVQSTDVLIDGKQGNQSIGMSGKLVCQKPRDFRFKANALGQPALDLGSNAEEFWFWGSREKPPYVFHCSHQDLAGGQVRLPFPFQPDMVLAAFGMGEYDKDKPYKLNTTRETVEMSEDVTTSSGKRMQKVTVFHRYQTAPPTPQVIAHLLRDESGKTICSATIKSVTVDRSTGAVLPSVVILSYPPENVEITMKLRDVQSVRIDANQAARMFRRSDLGGFPSFDLARGKPDHVEGVSQAGSVPLQRVGGRGNGWER